MNLRIDRFHFGDEYTIGRMYVDGVFECYTLEDAVREVPTRPVAEWKVQNRTAIPRGRYQVAVTFSNRFRKPLPLIKDVPGFAGVRIHAGNNSANTEGCILVGKTWEGGDWIGSSRAAFDPFFKNMLDAHADGEAIVLDIE